MTKTSNEFKVVELVVNENMVMWAFRYALGRKTYAVNDVADYLIKNWNSFSPYFKAQVHVDIENAIKDKNAGMDMDIRKWKEEISKWEQEAK